MNEIINNSFALSLGTNYEAITAEFAKQLQVRENSRGLYLRNLSRFFSWVDSTARTLSTLTRADIIQYREHLGGLHLSECTINSYLTAVKLFYIWAASNKIYPNIAQGVKCSRDSKYKRDYLTATKAHELVEETAATASPRDNAIIALLVRNGLRTIEVIRANVEDLQINAGRRVLYVQGKRRTAKDKFVILSPKTYALIEAYLKTRRDLAPDTPLFTNNNHNRNYYAERVRAKARQEGEEAQRKAEQEARDIEAGRLTTRTISKIAREHLDNIGLQKIPTATTSRYTAHSLRHTCACLMLESGTPDAIVQLTLRHASPATTQLYTYHVEEHRRINYGAEIKLDNIF